MLSESLGFEKGVGRGAREAPVFMGVIAAMIAISTIVAVIPGVPVISLLVGVQVINGAAAADQPLLHLAAGTQRGADGRAPKPRRRRRGLTAATVAVTSALSLILVAVTIFGL